MILAPLPVEFFKNLQGKWFYFIKTFANIIPDIRGKVSKIKHFSVNQQTLYTMMKRSKDIIMETDIAEDMRLRGVISNLDGAAKYMENEGKRY